MESHETSPRSSHVGATGPKAMVREEVGIDGQECPELQHQNVKMVNMMLKLLDRLCKMSVLFLVLRDGEACLGAIREAP